MGIDTLAIIAGTVSSLIFVGSHVPMLLKAYRTGDLHSYSSLNLIMVNVGNLIYWLYVSSLPAGPIWVLHTFYTLSSVLLLIMYCRMLWKEFANRGRVRSGNRQASAISRLVHSLINNGLLSLTDHLSPGTIPRSRHCATGYR